MGLQYKNVRNNTYLIDYSFGLGTVAHSNSTVPYSIQAVVHLQEAVVQQQGLLEQPVVLEQVLVDGMLQHRLDCELVVECVLVVGTFVVFHHTSSWPPYL